MEQSEEKPTLVVLVPDDADLPSELELAIWTGVYNEMVQEFVKLLEEEFGVIAPLPPTWEEGRAFLVGQPEWDMIINAIHDLQEVVR